MNNFKIIYKILKELEKAMDLDEFNSESISHEILKVSYARWEKIIIMLVTNGYIQGVVVTQTAADYSPHIANPIQPIITLKGLEYLEENSLMKKAGDFVKGTIDIVK